MYDTAQLKAVEHNLKLGVWLIPVLPDVLVQNF